MVARRGDLCQPLDRREVAHLPPLIRMHLFREVLIRVVGVIEPSVHAHDDDEVVAEVVGDGARKIGEGWHKDDKDKNMDNVVC